MAPVLRKSTIEQTKKIDKIVNRRRLEEKLKEDRKWNLENVLWFKYPDLVQRTIMSYLNPKSLMEFSKTSKDIKYDVFSFNETLYALHLTISSNLRENEEKEKGTKIMCQKLTIRRPQIIARYGDDVEVWDYFGRVDVQKKVVWEEIETAKKIDVVVAKHLNKYLEMYQNSIQQFSFENKITSIYSFNLTGLRRLIDLQIRSKEEVDVLEIGMITLEQFMRLTKVLAIDTNLSFDKIIKFKAKYADIKCEELDEQKAFEYLRMWEDEELPQCIEYRTIRNMQIDNLDLTACESHLEQNQRNPYHLIGNSIKRSPNYLDSIHILDVGVIYINFVFDENEDERHFNYGYGFERLCSRKTKVTYTNYHNSSKDEIFPLISDEPWKITENGGIHEVALRYINKYLDLYKNSIKTCKFASNRARFLNKFDLKNLKRLKTLSSFCCQEDNTIIDRFITSKQFSRLRSFATFRSIFTFDQILEFNGEKLTGKCLEFDEELNRKYLEMVANGNIHENIRNIDITKGERKELDFGLDFYAKGFKVLSSQKRDDKSLAFTIETNFKPAKKLEIVINNAMFQMKTTGWFDIPFELREMVISHMDAKTRCKFSECSRKCEDEVKEWKDHMNRIIFFEYDEISCLCFEFCGQNSEFPDYGLEFSAKRSTRTTITYRKFGEIEMEKKDDFQDENREMIRNSTKMWTKSVRGAKKDVVLQYLKDSLKTYQKSCRYFLFENKTTSIFDFDLKDLKRLDSIYVDCIENVDFMQIGFMEQKQYCQLKHIITPSKNLKFSEILEFPGRILVGKCDEMDPQTIKNYLEMWKNGKIREDLFAIRVETPQNSNLDMRFYNENLKVFKCFQKTSFSKGFVFEIPNGKCRVEIGTQFVLFAREL
ncbi:unnamed protein product [Caenorhabditis angaria]|uniref:F-box domain-containing protein n=1 Tax=Caenorhabditis angaria TaxID=860376 RepID=A0A9P1MWU0_9PELO|nr:unnamed protein product [Caenorhabditis angaria]